MAMTSFNIEDVRGRLAKDYKFRRPSSVCIYKVPTYLKNQPDSGEQHYVPQMVGLGPYHHRATNLAAMEDHKLEAVRRTLGGLLDKTKGQPGIDFVISEIQKIEEDIKDCYEDEEMLNLPDDVDPKKFAWMFILDGCFILEIFRNQLIAIKNAPKKIEEQRSGIYRALWNDFEPVFSPERLDFIQGFVVLNDMMKLENQIPLIVLKKLLELQFKSSKEAEKKLFEYLNECILKTCSPFDFPEREANNLSKMLGESRHMLEFLFRRITEFICTSGNDDDHQAGVTKQAVNLSAKAGTMITIPPATALDDAGIKLQPISDSGRGIEFRKSCLSQQGTVYLPKMKLSRNKEVVLRNLIALEECRAVKENFISRYAALMDDLVDSEADVALLRKKGILDSQLGSDGEAANLFNSLCTGITRNSIPRIDADVVQLVKRHYDSKLKVLLGEFIKQHFSKPWYVVILGAAALELGMTAVQTYYSITG